MSPTAHLLADVLDYLRRYMVLSDEQAGTIALWVLHTHALDAANATPSLRVTSAVPSCGKSRLFDVLRPVVAGGLKTSGLSAAMLPRVVDSRRPTLLLDELDNMMQGDREMAASLTGILNDGYRRGGSTFKGIPGKGNQWDVVEFNVFCPKAFAGIKALDKALSTRCIPIRLKPKRSDQVTDDFYVGTTPPEHAELIGRLEGWGAAAGEQLSPIKSRRLASVSDRTAEVGRHCYRSQSWPEVNGSPTRSDTPTRSISVKNAWTCGPGLLALRKLRALFGKARTDVPTADLIAALNGDAELPFAEMGKDGINAHRLARPAPPVRYPLVQSWLRVRAAQGLHLAEVLGGVRDLPHPTARLRSRRARSPLSPYSPRALTLRALRGLRVSQTPTTEGPRRMPNRQIGASREVAFTMLADIATTSRRRAKAP